MGEDHGHGLDEHVHRIGARRYGQRAGTQVQHREGRLVVLVDDRLHLGVDPGVAREIRGEPVGELQDVTGRRPEDEAGAVRREGRALRFGKERERHVVGVRRVHDGDFHALRGFRGLGDEGAAEVGGRTAGSRDRHRRHAGRLGTHAHGLVVAEGLDLAGDESPHVDGHRDRGILRGGDLRGGGVRPGRHPFRVRAFAGAQGLQLLVADVVAVRVAQQHDVDGTQPRIVRAGHGVAGIVEDAHAGRILEERR